MSRRWCTTTNTPGGRQDATDLYDAMDRVHDLAGQHLIGAGTTERVTVWFRDNNGHGWQSLKVIDIAAHARRYRRALLQSAS